MLPQYILVALEFSLALWRRPVRIGCERGGASAAFVFFSVATRGMDSKGPQDMRMMISES